MPREITYYLVRKISMGRRPRATYYYLTPSGEPATTINPKIAMRWLTDEGARQQAKRLGIWWRAVPVTFPGNELCVPQAHQYRN